MMSSAGLKKDEVRFTIRFNPADPRHQKAMGALQSSGRRKATLIADAVCEYLERYGGVETAVILPQSNPCPASADAHKPGLLGDDGDLRSAVLGGLSMFKV